METIFVSIASYLDPEFKPTIRDCFEKAKYPERITIGLHLQDEVRVIQDYLTDLQNNQIKTLTTKYTAAKGCGWARNMIMRDLYTAEDYFLLVDSHTRFKENWDEIYINRLKELPDNSVISVFPRHYDLGEKYETYSKRDIPTIYIPNEIPFVGNFRGPHRQKLCKERYEKVMNISGGNTFGPGSMVKALTLTDYDFYGHQEQELYSLLLYKAGFDIYAINDNIIWHKYFVANKDDYRQIYSERKVRKNFWPEAKNFNSNVRSGNDWKKDYESYCNSWKPEK
jgi:hypothetical protein